MADSLRTLAKILNLVANTYLFIPKGHTRGATFSHFETHRYVHTYTNIHAYKYISHRALP